MTTRTYIIAEAGVNHDGDAARARKLIDIAKQAGADAVKFQLFRPELLVTAAAKTARYQSENLADNTISQRDMLRKLTLPEGEMARLSAYCESHAIDFLCTPFDHTSLQELHAVTRMRYLKLASGEVTNGPLLLAAARTGLPVILSTGMSNLDEISHALAILHFGYTTTSGYPTTQLAYAPTMHGVLKNKITLLHCVSQYPAPYESLNLRAIHALKAACDLAVGFSDHSPGIHAAVAAVAMGASVIEKHLTYDQSAQGPDHKASLSPDELIQMIRQIRDVESALGDGKKLCRPEEEDTRTIARRSVVTAKAISKGEIFSEGNLVCKRPAGGLEPSHMWQLFGKAARHNYAEDSMLQIDELS